MKTFYLLLIFIFLSLSGKSQEYSFPLYFEDSQGNRDTLYFGFDKNATFDIDEQFGEVNLINEPLDSNFAVFFTDAAKIATFDDGDCAFERPLTPSYISKKQFNNPNNFICWIELGLVTKNWPVTISWDHGTIEYFVSKQGDTRLNVYMYSWNPPVSLNGDLHCCGFWPGNYTLLDKTSYVVVEESNFCHYASTVTKGTVNPFFIYFSSFTGIEEIVKRKANFWYDPKEKIILFSNNGEQQKGIIEVFDTFGRIQIVKTINDLESVNFTFDAGSLIKGTYIIRFSSFDNHPISITQKILVQ